jgi:hypothetical protein
MLILEHVFFLTITIPTKLELDMRTSSIAAIMSNLIATRINRYPTYF